MNTHYLDHETTTTAGSALFKEVPQPAIFSKLPSTGDKVFDIAIRAVFHHEGFYSDDPHDPGGPTAWGWSLRAAMKAGDLDGDGQLDFDINNDGHVDMADIIALKDDPAKAVNLYKLHYWDRYAYDRLPERLGIKVMDLAVVMGASQSHKLLQRSFRSASDQRLVEDGIIGRRTLSACSKVDVFPFLCAYRSEAAGFFRLLASQRPQSRKYLDGWLNRAYF